MARPQAGRREGPHRLAIASPRPCAPRPWRARRTSSETGAGSPGPSSQTSIRTPAPEAHPTTVTRAAPCSIALAIRLPVTCASRSGHPGPAAATRHRSRLSSTPASAALGRQAWTESDSSAARSIRSRSCGAGPSGPPAGARRGRRAPAPPGPARGRSPAAARPTAALRAGRAPARAAPPPTARAARGTRARPPPSVRRGSACSASHIATATPAVSQPARRRDANRHQSSPASISR